MPLSKGKSKEAFQHNLKAELHAGKPKAQALAIAFAVKRQKRSEGGMISRHDEACTCDSCMDEGGMANEKMHPGYEPKGLAERIRLMRKAGQRMHNGGLVAHEEDMDDMLSQDDEQDTSYSSPGSNELGDIDRLPEEDNNKKRQGRLSKVLARVRSKNMGGI